MSLSPTTWALLIAGLVATLIFAAGFVRGVRAALRSFRQPDDGGVVGKHSRVGAIILSTAASGVVSALIGVFPQFIYAGPVLVILATAAIGIAFLVEDRLAGN